MQETEMTNLPQVIFSLLAVVFFLGCNDCASIVSQKTKPTIDASLIEKTLAYKVVLPIELLSRGAESEIMVTCKLILTEETLLNSFHPEKVTTKAIPVNLGDDFAIAEFSGSITYNDDPPARLDTIVVNVFVGNEKIGTCLRTKVDRQAGEE